MMAWYAEIKLLHVACVLLSGGLFALRGLMRVAGLALANHRVLRVGSVLIDTTLLVAALMLVVMLRQYPFVQAWLTVKVVLLVVYIALGVIALKRARTRSGRAFALIAALSVYAFMISVAVVHHPLGAFASLAR